MNTVVWSLGKSLGDTLSYQDDRGRVFPIRIVGILANSILQGSLLVSERNFVERFPSQEGYQAFLIDAPQPMEAVRHTLTRALEDVGLELTPAAERLAAFNTVENAYLSIFAALGGLGLLLGSIGLGVVVLRNVLERRGELALLRAVGFQRGAIQWLLFSEAGLLLALGLAAGVVSALVAVLPALRSPGAEVPAASLTLTLAAIFISGFLWTWGATWLSLRGSPLAALRNE
jgi:putative ABC transport system permease protein